MEIDTPENIPQNVSAHITKPGGFNNELPKSSQVYSIQAVTWTLKVILVEFQDVLGNANGAAWTRADFANMLFSSNYYNTETNGIRSPAPYNDDVYGSLRDYYDAMSNGNLIITGQILNSPKPGGDLADWIRLSHNKSWHYSNSYWNLHNEAITLANARGYDTSTNSTTKLVILYAGNHYLANLTPRNLSDSYIMYERWPGRTQYGDAYDANAPFGHIEIHAHEFGHFFGWPDLGNYIVDWCLMGDAPDLGGTLDGTDIQRGSCPGPVNAELRRQRGWITVQNLTSDILPASISYDERSPTVYRKQIGTNEYFVFESKHFLDFSRFLPGHSRGHDGGLLIWQVQGTSSIHLERADNIADGEYYAGEPNDIFPGPDANNTSFHPLSTPNSNTLGNARSGFALTNISVISGTGASANAYINYLISNSTEATASNNSRKLAREISGKYHLVYESGGEIYYQYSMTGADTWLGLTRLSVGNGNNRYPCVAERGGRVYVVWQRYDGSSHDVHFRKSTNGGSTWGGITEPASNIGANAPLPAIVCPATDKLVVIYRASSNLGSRISTNDGRRQLMVNWNRSFDKLQ